MKTEQQIRQKITQLTNQMPNFSNENQIRIIYAEIKRLQWVLGEGLDVVLVPKPAR